MIVASDSRARLSRIARAILGALDSLPWSLLALPMRLAGFIVFWRAGIVKLHDWQGTLMLFREEYRVPVLPPELAAALATSVEIGAAIALLLGFLTRLSALVLLGLTAVIQVFVYPEAWPTHAQWLAFLLPLLARGPGELSLDHLIARRLVR
ncbi:MAG: DoxX family protein [Alphaproteobacteria bacterium]|nr:DoxX family protein [Alphaproteobacteria bacterium]